jgi:hypothetical protein
MDILKKNKKVAIYNGFPFHYEMIGYLLYYCLEKNMDIVVYCSLDRSNGYNELFKQLFENNNFEYRCMSLFDSEKEQYDFYILVTDDDFSFNTDNENVNNRTIRIDHSIDVRRSEIKKCIATRPFFDFSIRPWALPCFPMLTLNNRLNYLKNNNKNETHVLILGHDYKYHTTIINRLSSERPIFLHAVSREMDESKFSNLNENITLKIYKDIETLELLRIAVKCDYFLTDCTSINYENKQMSGSIPLSFSLLVPLIISKQTNSHYQFKNVIEFDKYNTEEPIILNNTNEEFFINLENERTKLIIIFFRIMDNYCSQL